MKHTLKTWPVPFGEIWDGKKKFEVRINDRNYQVGDELILLEYDPVLQMYCGGRIEATVVYVMQGGQFGIEPDYVVMSLGDFSARIVSPQSNKEYLKAYRRAHA